MSCFLKLILIVDEVVYYIRTQLRQRWWDRDGHLIMTTDANQVFKYFSAVRVELM